ncbi:MAG: cytochrome c biogenesis protein CcdA [Alphaproteobacteria bacterium]|nr:cytochrome c biogenesis protein CcdA [Alphaproteobacteria bacterium]
MTGIEIGFLAAALGGLISFLSPCVLPLVPAYLCFVAGISFDRLTEEGATAGPELRRQVMAGAGAFVLGFTTVFVALGASASVISNLLVGQLDVLARIAGVVIVLFGLHMAGLLRIPWLNREARFTPDRRGGGGLLGAYIVGLAFAFGWTPCIGPILGAILAVAASQETLASGMALLAVYSLGLGVPFLLAAFGVRAFMSFMQRFRQHMHKVEIVSGGLLVVTGVMIFFGSLQQFSYLLLELFPALGTIG